MSPPSPVLKNFEAWTMRCVHCGVGIPVVSGLLWRMGPRGLVFIGFGVVGGSCLSRWQLWGPGWAWVRLSGWCGWRRWGFPYLVLWRVVGTRGSPGWSPKRFRGVRPVRGGRGSSGWTWRWRSRGSLVRCTALDWERCPFDRSLAVTVPQARAVAEGSVDLEDLTRSGRGGRGSGFSPSWSGLGLRTRISVCHGDLCPDNVLLDPRTCEVTGLIDWGGSAVRTGTPISRGAGVARAARVGRGRCNRRKSCVYRLLDEFF
uniref:Aminoglycoside-O-phosphotransferase type 5 n=1 Tax=Streptomyces rimosus TaxID=1927 RepID=Q55011_STRRM|nr:aminoglycoside-O-phosphotransferase type 5 [Streptomyces rimosus]